MADDIRIKDLQSTASYMESDDYLPIDSLALGNRKIPFTGLMDSEDDRLPTTDKTPRGAITEHEEDISEIKQSLSDLEEHEYIVTRWVTFTYYTATQLEGTYTFPTVPSGYSVRLLGCMSIFANTAMGAKFSGKFLSSTGNKLRALGSGFVSGDSESFLVLFLVYKS